MRKEEKDIWNDVLGKTKAGELIWEEDAGEYRARANGVAYHLSPYEYYVALTIVFSETISLNQTAFWFSMPGRLLRAVTNQISDQKNNNQINLYKKYFHETTE